MAKTKDKPLSIVVPLFASALVPLAVASPIPFVDETIAGLISAGAWLKYFGDRGVTVTGQKSNPRKNPVILGTTITAAGALGAAAMGLIAVKAYQAYAEETEREPAQLAVEQDPMLSMVNPAVGAAVGAAVGYATGRSVWKSTLYGAFFGIALRRLAVEVIHAQSKVQ